MTRSIQPRRLLTATTFLTTAFAAMWLPTPLFATEEEQKDSAAIPIRFELQEPGYVTLVIDDEAGTRVHNLIANTYFEAGKHQLNWDGFNEGEKLTRPEGLDTHRQRVEAGTYRVRGLVHKGMGLRYETAVHAPGNPPWHTQDRRGAWLADHTPPADVVYLPKGTAQDPQPQILVSAPTAEAGHSLMYLDLDGKKLWGGKIRGWRSGQNLAMDRGAKADPQYLAFAVVQERRNVWLYGLTNTRDAQADRDRFKALVQFPPPEFEADEHWVESIARRGMAVHNGLLVIGYHRSLNELMVFDMHASGGADAALPRIALDDPRGLWFDAAGRLFAISGKRVLRFDEPDLRKGQLGKATVLIDGPLEDPGRIMVDDDGRMYIADLGSRHQVLVFDPKGKPLRTIGTPGGPQLGLYNEHGMSRPAGMAVDKNGKLWVAELEYGPKRISRWHAASGEFDYAWYGPPKYGGGGLFDPKDRTRFYYSSANQGIEFKVDWDKQRSIPSAIYWRNDIESDEGRCPDSVVYVDGHRFLTNNFFGPSYFAAGSVDVFLQNPETGIVERVAHVGRPPDEKHERPALLGLTLDEHPRLAALVKEKGRVGHAKGRAFIWSDLNRNGTPELEELTFFNWRDYPGQSDLPSLNIHADLSVTTSDGHHLPPPRVTDRGVPVWDLARVTVPAPQMRGHLSNSLRGSDGTYINTMGRMVQQRLIQGFRDGERVWHINGFRNQHIAEHPGQMINAMRHIGHPFTPTRGEGGEMFILNGFMGSLYLLTTDGLLVSDLGGDERVMPHFTLPESKRGQIVRDFSFKAEHFWPGSVQMEDGTVYVIAGKESSNVFELAGCDTIRRLSPWLVSVSAEQLAGLPAKLVVPGEERQVARQATVRLTERAPQVDGDAADWADADWVTIDRRLGIDAALQVHDKTLYAVWRTQEPHLPNNDAGDGWQHVFTTGGGLDLMLRTAGEADRKPDEVMAGDIRLFVTRLGDPIEGRVMAVRFQQVGGEGETVDYTSPVGAVQFDSVVDVSSHIRLAQQGGVYELAVPLAVLGLKPKPGLTTRGDIGVLLGDGSNTYARLYWSNKGTFMTTDIPSEARLEPRRWGQLLFTEP